MKINNNKKAFTLLEVLITMVILSIIAAIVFPIIFHAIPSANLMKFRKMNNSIAAIMEELTESDKYYFNGDLGKDPNENLITSATYFCDSIADIVSTKQVNCHSTNLGYNASAAANVYSGGTTSVWGKDYLDIADYVDCMCQTQRPTSDGKLSPDIITSDNMYIYIINPAWHFGAAIQGGSKRLFNLCSASSRFKYLCVDIDGDGEILPFGYGIRADGHIVYGRRALAWMDKSLNKENDNNLPEIDTSICPLNQDMSSITEEDDECDYKKQSVACVYNIDNCAEYNINCTCKTCKAGTNTVLSVDNKACCLADSLCTKFDSNCSCSECINGYKVSGGSCVEATPHCAAYSAGSVCNTCQSDYCLCTATNTCNKIPDYCATCNNTTGVCAGCNSGYCLNATSNTCDTKPTNCSTCHATSGKCSGCSDGYCLNTSTNKCATKPTNCSTCDNTNGVCASCNTSYKISNGACVPCAVSQCTGYSSGCTCSSCNTGYKVSSGSCVSCAVTGCTGYSSGCTCSSCSSGYKVVGGVCVWCSTPSYSCSNSSYCTLTGSGNNWVLRIKGSTTVNFSKVSSSVDVFLVGGGASGSTFYGAGGGGGYTVTHKNVGISGGSYWASVGAGGAGGWAGWNGPWQGNAGGSTSFLNKSVSGGQAPRYGYVSRDGAYAYSYGGHGGSAGACFEDSPGSNGSGGGGAYYGNNHGCNPSNVGQGQGSTTRAFGESSGELFSTGGGGEVYQQYQGASGAANTGNGGAGSGGSGRSGSGGSGIILVRSGSALGCR